VADLDPTEITEQMRTFHAEDVAEQDAEFTIAGKPRCLHETGLAPHIGFRARNAHIERKIDDGGCQDDEGAQSGGAER